jgi:NADH dehydrogenase [ubiquinone] 1 alpha subcomplex assembly factor 5
MSSQLGPSPIFDPRRRLALRGRAGRRTASDPFLWHRIADELHERLKLVSRDFNDVLIIGPLAAWCDDIMGDRRVRIHKAALCEAERCKGAILIESEDLLPFAAGSFDLIISAGTLDSVNDVPGALLQMRRCLRPDGLLLATLFGAGTLSTLKSVMLAAAFDQVQPHIHPQIELKLAADLLVRAGFALPVADLDTVQIRYQELPQLISDIRDMGIGNALVGPRTYLGRDFLQRLNQEWKSRMNDQGRVTEYFKLMHLSGWSPSPDQPKPARRGSGQVSLAAVFGQNNG